MKNEKARTVASVRIQIVERILWHKVLGSDELSVFAVFFNVAPFSESRSDILFILLDYNTKKENRNTGKIVLKIMRKF